MLLISIVRREVDIQGMYLSKTDPELLAPSSLLLAWFSRGRIQQYECQLKGIMGVLKSEVIVSDISQSTIVSFTERPEAKHSFSRSQALMFSLLVWARITNHIKS